ncbi:class I SAM-dependent methyltransferase [bacterium]|nr:class I SAM-dependent methyltransferase [bacterium]
MDKTSTEIEGHVTSGDGRKAVAVGYASKYSLLVRFKNGDLICDGTDFDQLTLQIEDGIFDLGACRLKTEPNIDGYSGRLVFTGDIYNMDSLFQNGSLEKLQAEFQNLPLILSHKNSIRQEFKDFSSNLTYDLRVYKTFFDSLDNEYQFEQDHIRKEIQNAVILTEGEKLSKYLDAQLDELDRIVAGYDKKEHERHGFYFRKLIWDFILCSPFMKRCNVKPRGYAGDSVMMSMIYSNDFIGDSTFSRLMHKHPIEHPAAQAVRNRRALIIDMLCDRQSRSNADTNEKMNVLSVACGPAFETQDILMTKADFQKYNFFLLDQDRQALLEASEIIEQREKKLGAKASVTYLNDSVRTMLALPRLKKQWGEKQFRFIYSLGLFDYLTPPVAKAVIGNLYRLLEPGGEMVVGNFHVQNPSKQYMEYWLDWVLYHRTEDDFLQMMDGVPSAESRVIFEDTRSQMFLHVKKPG